MSLLMGTLRKILSESKPSDSKSTTSSPQDRLTQTPRQSKAPDATINGAPQTQAPDASTKGEEQLLSKAQLLAMVKYISKQDGAAGPKRAVDVVSTILNVCGSSSTLASHVVPCIAAMIECGTGPTILLRDSPVFALPGRLLNLFASHSAGAHRQLPRPASCCDARYK